MGKCPGKLVGTICQILTVLVQTGLLSLKRKRVLDLIEGLRRVLNDQPVELLASHVGPLSAQDRQETLDVCLPQPEATEGLSPVPVYAGCGLS
jgi:hypothetical protein